MTVRQPCRSCPWRVDQDASDIPGFSLEKAEGLAETCPQNGYGPEFGTPMFACHQSRESEEIVCAGWLATCGHAHPNARLLVSVGTIDREALQPGEDWPELHEDFEAVIEKLRGSS